MWHYGGRCLGTVKVSTSKEVSAVNEQFSKSPCLNLSHHNSLKGETVATDPAGETGEDLNMI